MALGFHVWGLSFNYHVFFQRDFHGLVIHDLVVHLVNGGKLLENRYPEQPMSSLWAYIESLRCCPVMHLLFPRFIRDSICLCPCVP